MIGVVGYHKFAILQYTEYVEPIVDILWKLPSKTCFESITEEYLRFPPFLIR